MIASLLILCVHLCIDATAAEVGRQASSDESVLQAEVEAAPETPRPKSSLNLSGLKAAFSSHHSSNSGNKSKAADSGPMQKTLQSFFKGTAKLSNFSSTLKSPQKMSSSPAKHFSAGKSVLDGFRYRTQCSDTDADKECTKPSCEVTVEEPDTQMWSTESRSPENITDSHTVKEEPLELADMNSATATEDAELHTKPCSFREEGTKSPDAKRARTEEPGSSTEDEHSMISAASVEPSLTLDAPVCMQKKAVPLLFSIKELAGRMKRLQDQQAQRSGDGMHYRRFKAKINPGENQSAEEELKKEIR